MSTRRVYSTSWTKPSKTLYLPLHGRCHTTRQQRSSNTASGGPGPVLLHLIPRLQQAASRRNHYRGHPSMCPCPCLANTLIQPPAYPLMHPQPRSLRNLSSAACLAPHLKLYANHKLRATLVYVVHPWQRRATHQDSCVWIVTGACLCLWHLKNNKVERVHETRGAISCLRQNPQQPHMLALASAEGQVVIYNTTLRKAVHTLKLTDTFATDVQFDPCSASYVIVCCRNGNISMHDTSSSMAEVSQYQEIGVHAL